MSRTWLWLQGKQKSQTVPEKRTTEIPLPYNVPKWEIVKELRRLEDALWGNPRKPYSPAPEVLQYLQINGYVHVTENRLILLTEQAKRLLEKDRQRGDAGDKYPGIREVLRYVWSKTSVDYVYVSDEMADMLQTCGLIRKRHTEMGYNWELTATGRAVYFSLQKDFDKGLSERVAAVVGVS